MAHLLLKIEDRFPNTSLSFRTWSSCSQLWRFLRLSFWRWRLRLKYISRLTSAISALGDLCLTLLPGLATDTTLAWNELTLLPFSFALAFAFAFLTLAALSLRRNPLSPKLPH